ACVSPQLQPPHRHDAFPICRPPLALPPLTMPVCTPMLRSSFPEGTSKSSIFCACRERTASILPSGAEDRTLRGSLRKTAAQHRRDRMSTRLNSSHQILSYSV